MNGVGNKGDVSDGRDDVVNDGREGNVVDDGREDNVVDEDDIAKVELSAIVGDNEEVIVTDGTEIDQMLDSSVTTKLPSM